MAYSETLAVRIRDFLQNRRGFVEKKMFGGVAFLLNGNVCCGVWKDSLILRVGPGRYEDALMEPNVREFDITGRPMTGWVMVGPVGIETEGELSEWIEQAIKFARTLPKKV